MKSGKFSVLRFTMLSVLMALFLYSASVQEIHYLFVDHHTELSEHCHNHLHSHVGHADCSLCKIELSSFLQSTGAGNPASYIYQKPVDAVSGKNVTLDNRHSSISLRGPPVVA
jgi:hypothetical protein